ncbi:MAG: class III poly(R)-hydroxyalkanoic acid synthase subunit PhaC [Caldilineaceae bacterium]|nr:class III poly(R)-hydroxyalkanoic acid synthase subunit PhaC [Caldilineaceae bacterium]
MSTAPNGGQPFLEQMMQAQSAMHTTGQELSALQERLWRGVENLSHFREEDVQFGTAPKEEVYREDKLVLYRYTPVVKKPFPIPLLISYALVNRPYMVDLQEDRSLVRNLLQLGIDVYLIDWGYPGPTERWNTLDDYINGYINNCVDVVRQRHHIEQINLLGICQGGSFSLCYAALYPDKIKNLITMVTPVDFHVPATGGCGLLNSWCQRMDPDLMVDAFGNVPGDYMNFGYLMLKPFTLNIGKYVGLTDIMDDERKLLNFLRMEKWIFDSPDQAGEAWRQFIKDFYQGNKLIKGEVVLGDQQVDLANITMPVLNLYAEEDHLVPPASTKALAQYVGSKDYTVRSFPAGHIGMYVSGKVQRDLPPTIADWLKERK